MARDHETAQGLQGSSRKRSDVAAHVGVKISKKSAHYTDIAPEEYKDEPCRECTYFERIEANHCSRVVGIIKAEGHCRLWEIK